jgi:translation initiation factor IF-2
MAKKKDNTASKIDSRNPVVAIMGHIDHGKSTLLDYIRKENTVDKEHGGITQHVAAYEASHNDKKITFIDTPGHEAFAAARSRGANIADIAILVVAADDGFSEQTKGALKFIVESKIPYVVAINKIDKTNADIQKTKNSLIENEVYLEGMGGDIPFTEISALKGTNVSELLDTVLLATELEELTTDINAPASGYVLEASMDPKKGISATMIIKNGVIKGGQHIVSGFASSPVRIMQDFLGNTLKEAESSMPITIIGFDELPQAGDSFSVFENKKEAFKYILELKELQDEKERNARVASKKFVKNKKNVFPLVIKTDVSGSLDAVKHELAKISDDRSEFKIIEEGIGSINEKSIKAVGTSNSATIIGFNVSVENNARFLADNLEIEIKNFSIIYELLEYLEERMKKLTPKEKFEEVTGEAKILKVFSWSNKGGVIGGEVTIGEIKKNNRLKIYRRGEFIGDANIKELQTGKKDVGTVAKPLQFGTNVTSKLEIVEGDIIKSIEIVEK